MVANDGFFFMPVENFRKPFHVMSVVRYQENWHSAAIQNKGNNPSTSGLYVIHIKNPVEQEVNIQFEHTPFKMVEPGCNMYKANYNILLRKDGKYI